jgi:mediator of RNA polymerase II transcription subunit 14
MILKMLQIQLQQGLTKSIFSPVGIVSLDTEGTPSHSVGLVADHHEFFAAGVHALRVRLCADEIVVITVDSRTGRLNLLDTGDLAAAGRAPRFSAISEKLNENPSVLADALVRLRLQVSYILGEGWYLVSKSDSSSDHY